MRSSTRSRARTRPRGIGTRSKPGLRSPASAPFAGSEAARLEELRLAAVDARIEAELGSGVHELLVPELERLISDHPYRERVGSAFAELAAVALRLGETEHAARLLGAAASLWEEVGVVVDAHERRAFDETEESVRGTLAAARFEELFAAGRRASADAFTAETLALARSWASSSESLTQRSARR